MNLLIAEKPDQASKYCALLEKAESEKFERKDGYYQGKNWTVSYCIGHLLNFSKELGKQIPQDANLLPFFPQVFTLAPTEGKEKQLGILSRLVKSAEFIVNGTDPEREGELIFGRVLEYNGISIKNGNIKRLWLNNYNIDNMLKAWGKLIDYSQLYNSYNAAFTRAELDWLIGLNCSMGYRLATRVQNLSLGRVQTPTLALIVERDLLVESAVDIPFYVYAVQINQVTFLLQNREDHKFNSKEDILKLGLSDGKEISFVVSSIDTKSNSKAPELPYYLGSLQKEASKKLGFSLDQTLEIAQKLYEAQLISYPRSDSNYLPLAMKDECYNQAQSYADHYQVKEKLRPQSDSFKQFNDSKVTSHHALIPIFSLAEGKGLEQFNLSTDELALLDLIVRKFLSGFMSNYRYDSLLYTATNETGAKYVAKGKKIIDKGWMAMYQTDEASSHEFSQAESLKGVGNIERKLEGKPKYFTPDTILTAMEHCGKDVKDEEIAELMRSNGFMLGRPATQGEIVKKLLSREYIEMKKNNIISTQKGRQLIKIVNEALKSAELTGQMESMLMDVEKGKKESIEVIEFARTIIQECKQDFLSDFSEQFDNAQLTCPNCEKGLVIKGKKAYGCSNWKSGCDFRVFKTIAGKSISMTLVGELVASKKTKVLKGFKSAEGKAFSAALILKDNKTVEMEFDKGKETKLSCPDCKQALKDKGSFYGCSGYAKGCKFSLPKKLSGKTLSEKILNELIDQGKTGVIKGFKSKKGTDFDASLTLLEGKITFAFSK